MVHASTKRHLYFAITLAVASGGGQARSLPHAELVAKYLQGEKHVQVLKGCKSRRMIAPITESDPQTECWAAAAASELKKAAPAVADMVLNDTVREAATSRCKLLSMDQRAKNAECGMRSGRAC